MKKIKLICLSLGTAILTACVTNNSSPEDSIPPTGISQIEKNQIALCSGGMSDSVRAELTGAVNAAELNATGEVELKKTIQGIIFSEDRFKTDESKLQAYELFLGCIKT